jgi:hypothetical protein
MSDIGYRWKFYSDIGMPDKILPSSPISEGPIEAQSDIADHGYRTKCPPMLNTVLFEDFLKIIHHNR